MDKVGQGLFFSTNDAMDFDFLNWIGHVPHKLLQNKIFFSLLRKEKLLTRVLHEPA